MTPEEQQAALVAALRPALTAQMKDEIKDQEDLPFKVLNMLKQKFGLAAPIYTPQEKYWISTENGQ